MTVLYVYRSLLGHDTFNDRVTFSQGPTMPDMERPLAQFLVEWSTTTCHRDLHGAFLKPGNGIL